jgi:hypothetical protein
MPSSPNIVDRARDFKQNRIRAKLRLWPDPRRFYRTFPIADRLL